MKEVLLMFGICIVQNASFTLVSRARNSGSLYYHALASVASNGTYLLVLRNVVNKFDNIWVQFAYVAGSVVGGIIMHKITMHFEKNPIKIRALIKKLRGK